MARRDSKGRFAGGSTKTAAATTNGERLSEYQMAELISNTLTSRSTLLSKLMDPRRDIDDECGYPKTIEATVYRELYDREPIATRVVQVLPKESWQAPPVLFETEDPEQQTPFELAWEELSTSLRGNSWYMGETVSPIWEHLKRADELSGIGSYGVLLLGLDDGAELKEPATRREGARLLYVRAFDESLAKITRYETDPTNPRYGQPVEYLITFNDPDNESTGSAGVPLADRHVHWTRIVHLADNLGSSEVFGVPRMRPVYNRLYDLKKLYSGSAEMYWRGAFPGLAIETHPQLGGDVEMDTVSIRGQLEQYMNGLQRYLSLMGMSAKSLAPQVVDPTPQINVQIEAICIYLGVPKRIFLGSERGELSSAQDDSTWNDRLRYRQEMYITPRIIVPFVDRLIELGVLPEPQQYNARWPELDSLSAKDQAAVAVQRTDALSKYVGGNVEAVMTPLDFLTRILGMDGEEAEAIIDATMEVEDDDKFTAPPEPEEIAGGEGEGEEEGGGPPEDKTEEE